MEKRLMVVQEHNADKAGVHWDIRFEAYGSLLDYRAKRVVTNEPMGKDPRILKSFCVPKARLPVAGEKILAISTEDHPWEYKDFSGVIESGYGKGTVKLLFCDYIDIETFTGTKIVFAYQGKWYRMYRVPMRNRYMWFFQEKK
jgi:bifunctional non-homologous end joining protein LigD